MPSSPRREGDPLCVIAGARSDHPARALVRPQVRDLVVRAAELEAEDRLQVLALQQDVDPEPARQPGGRIEGRLTAHVVHAARQDQPQHLIAARRCSRGPQGVRYGHGPSDYMRREPTKCLRETVYPRQTVYTAQTEVAMSISAGNDADGPPPGVRLLGWARRPVLAACLLATALFAAWRLAPPGDAAPERPVSTEPATTTLRPARVRADARVSPV